MTAAQSREIVVQPTGTVARFFWGMSYLPKGGRYVLRHRSLVPWCLGPVLTAIVLLGAFMVLASRGISWMSERLAGHGLGAGVLYFFLMAFVGVAVLYFGLVTVASLAAGPFCGLLAERVEALATGEPGPKQSLGAMAAEVVRGVVHALARTGLYLAVTLPLTVVTLLLPPLGPLVVVVQFGVTGMFLAYDFLDYPLGRRGYGFGRKWSYIEQHRAEALGFGVAVALLLLVPFVNLVVPPLAAVGATLLFVHLEPVKALGGPGGLASWAPKPGGQM
ncbi:MAG TPA: EI24 domain-containing protein [Polyangia bacterium]|jgi:CysZ protein|nr:EI24 domain-containing protein [Polyangia bacterium]